MMKTLYQTIKPMLNAILNSGQKEGTLLQFLNTVWYASLSINNVFENSINAYRDAYALVKGA